MTGHGWVSQRLTMTAASILHKQQVHHRAGACAAKVPTSDIHGFRGAFGRSCDAL